MFAWDAEPTVELSDRRRRAWQLAAGALAWAPVSGTPNPDRGSPSVVWTGEEVIVWGGSKGHGSDRDDGWAWAPP